VADKDIKAGDEITVAYVDVDQREGESAIDCRQRRRIELAQGWKLTCQCARCTNDGPLTLLEGAELPKVDESKLEEPVARHVA
jgi:import receptor subunit TOM20